ncbi:hypothetical protein FACS189487_03850 [Campylobacterota bacterium]|nr:hypothetical protein FACS189487_03850 [Campylobacterota bacterium]
MGAVNTQINNILDGFIGELSPIQDCCKKYIKYNSNLGRDNSIRIGYNPSIAPEHYSIKIYESVMQRWIYKFQEKNKIDIPEIYQNMLLKMNGCFIFNMALCGLQPHIYSENKNVFRPQCLGLDSANNMWKKKYKTNIQGFHFGGRMQNGDENIGYFMADDKIYSILTSGKTVNEYSNFTDFLRTEIELTEEDYFLENKLAPLSVG